MRTAGNRRKLLDCTAGQWVELVAHAGRIASIDRPLWQGYSSVTVHFDDGFVITAPAATKVATW